MVQDGVRKVALNDTVEMVYDDASVNYSVVSGAYWRQDVNKRPWANIGYPVEGENKPVLVAVRFEWLVLGVATSLVRQTLARGVIAVDESQAPLIQYRDGNPLNCCVQNLLAEEVEQGPYYEPFLPKEALLAVYVPSAQRAPAAEAANSALFGNEFTERTAGGNLYRVVQQVGAEGGALGGAPGDATVRMLVSHKIRSKNEWHVALLDVGSLPRVQHLRWARDKDGYIVGSVDNRYVASMHRLIAVDPDNVEDSYGRIVDHRNGNRHDNRTANLRLATRQVNWANSRRRWTFRGAKDTRKRYAGYWRLRFKQSDNTYFDRQYTTLTDAFRADYTLRRQAGAEREQILYQLHPLPKSITADDLYTDDEIDSPAVLAEIVAASEAQAQSGGASDSDDSADGIVLVESLRGNVSVKRRGTKRSAESAAM